MTPLKRDATVVSAVLGVLAVAEVGVGATHVLHNGLSPSAHVVWSGLTAALLAMASVGMFLRRAGGWYLAVLATSVLGGQWLEEVVAGSRAAMLMELVVVALVLGLIRVSGWFPGAEHRRVQGARGFNAPQDAWT